MGLSDGTRFNGVVHIVEDMYNIEIKHPKIKELLSGLWFDLLGKTSNGAHWFFGSDSSAPYLGEMSLLTVAFLYSGKKDDEYAPWEDTVLHWREHFGSISAERLLESASEEARVWRLLCLCESYFYYTNRYDDELSASLTPVTRTVATLRGILHSTVKNDPLYRNAWMMQLIINRCFLWDEDDIVSMAGKTFNLHHDLRAGRQDVETITKIFKRYQFAYFSSAQKRMFDILTLCGGKFHYAHQHVKLMQMVERWNNHQIEIAMSNHNYKPDIIDENKLRRLLAKKCREPKEVNWRSYCFLTGQESK